VTVSANIERRSFKEKKERVNPEEAAVLSEQRSEETRSAPGASTGGVPGTPSNVPGGEGAESTGGGQSNETVTRETINFEVSRSTSQTVVPMGQVQKLSVALLVDGSYTATEVAEGEEPQPPVYQPRSEEELEQLGDIVQRAVGFDAERGDVIEVQNVRFDSPLDNVAAEPLPFWQSPEVVLLAPGVTRGLGLVIGISLLILLVVRPALKQLALGDAAVAIAASRGEGGGAIGTPGAQAPQAIRDEAAELAIPVSKDQAEQVAEAFKQLLRE
jgi:flagellar M-ring protein FliF